MNIVYPSHRSEAVITVYLHSSSRFTGYVIRTCEQVRKFVITNSSDDPDTRIAEAVRCALMAFDLDFGTTHFSLVVPQCQLAEALKYNTEPTDDLTKRLRDYILDSRLKCGEVFQCFDNTPTTTDEERIEEDVLNAYISTIPAPKD